jgi:hypothetical protein
VICSNCSSYEIYDVFERLVVGKTQNAGAANRHKSSNAVLFSPSSLLDKTLDLCHCAMDFSKCRHGEILFTVGELKVPPSKTLLQKISDLSKGTHLNRPSKVWKPSG